MYKSLEQQTKERVLAMFGGGSSVLEISKALNLQLAYVRSITGTDTRKCNEVFPTQSFYTGNHPRIPTVDHERLQRAMAAPYQGVTSNPQIAFYGLDFADLEERANAIAAREAEKARPTPIERLAEARSNAEAKVREKAATEALLNVLLSRAYKCECPRCVSKRQQESAVKQEQTLPESRADLINQIKERSTEDLTFLSMIISRELNKRYNDPIKQGKSAPDSSIS